MTHSGSSCRRRLGAALQLLVSLIALLAITVGAPIVLAWSVGTPWPASVTSLSDLMERLSEPVSDPFLTKLLALIAWWCWAAFMVTLVREAFWAARELPAFFRDGTVLRHRLRTVPAHQAAAAFLTGTLLLALATMWRPQAASAQQPYSTSEIRPHIAATAPLTSAPTPRSAPSTAVTANPRTQAANRGHRPAWPGPHTLGEAARYAEYTVREGDTLWDIARAHMGDPLAWPRIYALNKDRVQSDGAQLHDPDQITPGWRLAIPNSQTTTPPPAPAPAPADRTPAAGEAGPVSQVAPAPHIARPGTSMSVHADTDHAQTRPGRRHEPTTRRPGTQRGPAAVDLGEAGLIGITAAVGLLAARHYLWAHQSRHRKPDLTALTAELPSLSTVVSRATRAAREATMPPRPYDPDSLIPRRVPPQRPQRPRTVTIGERDNTEVTLDELAIPGGCTWTGPGAEGAARALLVGILTAAERQRRKPARVTAVVPKDVAEHLLPGLPPQFTALTQKCDIAQTIEAAEQHLIAHARTHDEQTHDDHDTPHTVTGAADTTEQTDPGTLILLTVPDAAHSGQLQALAARSDPDALIVLALGAPLPGAACWSIAADGTTTRPGAQGQHPSGLRLFHLTPDAGLDMTEMLLGAHGQRPRLRLLPTPRPEHSEHPGIVTNPACEPEPEAEPQPETQAAPAASHTTDVLRPAQTNPVRLHVLGPVTLYARGLQEPFGTNLRSEVHEFLALLAAHPAGLLASDIADKLRLDTESEQLALKNLRRAVRRALRAATGITTQEFILLHGELHKLNPQLVETDLADFTHHLKQAFPTTGKTGTEDMSNGTLPALREALSHYRGPFAHSGDYLWADAIREHLATQATDAVLRLAHHAERADADPSERDAVLPLLEHLAAIHPDHERLVQQAIRLYQDAGRHDAAHHSYTRLQRHLAELGLEPEPATQALITPRTRSRQAR
ncbi:LysM peptidoglycan-binding domain-containing protein [Streptomyces sp. RB6PN25]|uniref:LysM peptidoglycan-binding domain-containing protein n=1 Tax=Streptomyces humicola TaxID=2953240 RepID=A0ABT1Q4U1_9ACTN|nr:BTAD domain-containing putative transcriptional regulator [Streptomyces humicola]MCQ4084398.1 LysM peptidoglycan-binding domain-containing protein [Streptomyces humicola]